MTFNFSSQVERFYPTLRDDLKKISKVSCWLDSDIPSRGVLVCVRMFPGGDGSYLSGLASAEVRSTVGYGPYRGWVEHPAGRIDLRISANSTRDDTVRYFSHELRHLGQFNQGKRDCGRISLYLTSRTCESDAEAFEDIVLETLRHRRGK